MNAVVRRLDVCVTGVYFTDGYDDDTSGSRGAGQARRSGHPAWPEPRRGTAGNAGRDDVAGHRGRGPKARDARGGDGGLSGRGRWMGIEVAGQRGGVRRARDGGGGEGGLWAGGF